MKIQIKKYFKAVLLGFLTASGLNAQTVWQGKVEIDRNQHDFGDVLVSDGPVKCTFSLKNVSDKPFAILKVVSSCGCTDVEWTRSNIRAGETGTISATYKNEDGPGTFNKTLTAYLDIFEKPLVFRLCGIVREKRIPVGEAFPYHFGALGLRNVEMKGPNVEQGQPRSGEFVVANLSDKDLSLSFKDVSEGISLNFPQKTIAAGKTATVSYTISPNEKKWGRQIYYAVPVVNGEEHPCQMAVPETQKPEKGAETVLSEPDPNLGSGSKMIGIRSWTKAASSTLTAVQKMMGPNLSIKESSVNFGRVKAGNYVKADFEIFASGKGDLKLYAINSDSRRVKAKGPFSIKSGSSGTVSVTFDTSSLPSGEVLEIVTLTTNSPSRPLVSLYLNGYIK